VAPRRAACRSLLKDVPCPFFSPPSHGSCPFTGGVWRWWALTGRAGVPDAGRVDGVRFLLVSFSPPLYLDPRLLGVRCAVEAAAAGRVRVRGGHRTGDKRPPPPKVGEESGFASTAAVCGSGQTEGASRRDRAW
jgi:hypothetical protein